MAAIFLAVRSFLSRVWNDSTFLEFASFASTLVLTVGAVIEYWEKIKHLALLAAKWMLRRATAFDRCMFRKILLHSIGPILVVVGIGGEMIFETQAFRVSNRETADLTKTAGDAKQSAIDAAGAAARAQVSANGAKTKVDAVGDEADQAEAKITSISKRAADIDLHMAAVEYALSARFVLDEDGLKNELMKDFKGSHIAFRSYAGDPEAYWLCAQLDQIADKAGVEPKFECAMEPLPRVPVPDLSITAPTVNEMQHLGMIFVRPGRVTLPGHGINGGIGPLTILVGTKASVRLWWPKPERQPPQKAPISKTRAKP